MQPLRLFNSHSKVKEVFQPLQPPKVGMYVCGPTVYDYCHIGHARAYLVFDLVYRLLKSRGYQVTYVRNLTDVDDKIIRRAEAEKTDFLKVSQTYTQAFQEDMRSLGVLEPTVEPKATEHIDGMIRMIETLIRRESAYVVDGDVYFAVKSFASYLALSGRNIDDLLSGARVEINELKRDPLDFALWKSAKPGEPSWESPWGKGRPGWHIECSVMSFQHLGVTLDIHGGGRDLIFPHHENERAQSECAHGKTFVRHWLHNGFVTLNKEKMSKSIGNLVTIRELLQNHHPEVLRHALISAHYRSPIEFADEVLVESKTALNRIYLFLQKCPAAKANTKPLATLGKAQKWLDEFNEALNDDLNTPKALAAIFEAVKEGNRLFDQHDHAFQAYGQAILQMGAPLGLLQAEPATFLQSGSKESSEVATGLAEWVEGKIAARNLARKNRDFKLADILRDEMTNRGIILEDKPNGTTTWRMK